MLINPWFKAEISRKRAAFSDFYDFFCGFIGFLMEFSQGIVVLTSQSLFGYEIHLVVFLRVL